MKTNLLLFSVVVFSFSCFAFDGAVDRRQDLLLQAQELDKEAGANSNNTVGYELERTHGGKSIVYTRTINLKMGLDHFEFSRKNLDAALAFAYGVPLGTAEQLEEWNNILDEAWFDVDSLIAKARQDGVEDYDVPSVYSLLNNILNEKLQKEVSFSVKPFKLKLGELSFNTNKKFDVIEVSDQVVFRVLHMTSAKELNEQKDSHLYQLALLALNRSSCEDLQQWITKAEGLEKKNDALVEALNMEVVDKKCEEAK